MHPRCPLYTERRRWALIAPALGTDWLGLEGYPAAVAHYEGMVKASHMLRSFLFLTYWHGALLGVVILLDGEQGHWPRLTAHLHEALSPCCLDV
jgi:hypothetical protein